MNPTTFIEYDNHNQVVSRIATPLGTPYTIKFILHL
jgi:hypothetical protein